MTSKNVSDIAMLTRFSRRLRVFQYSLGFGIVCLLAIAAFLTTGRYWIGAFAILGVALMAAGIWYVQRLRAQIDAKIRDVT